MPKNAVEDESSVFVAFRARRQKAPLDKGTRRVAFLGIKGRTRSSMICTMCRRLVCAVMDLTGGADSAASPRMGASVMGSGRRAASHADLFTVSGDAYNATAGVTESWYKAEADIYGAFGAAPNMDTFHEWGHLTQVLWKKTTHVGCVTIDCGSKMTIDGAASELGLYTVCNYSPPGNYEGEYAENVAAPIASYKGYSWLD